ncbi:MAG: hypothetical protein HQ568_04010 [Calditrichaeota bacterium]|nr:hypothetical protein [Calditrichota bacterium]
MTTKVLDLFKKVKSISPEERDDLFILFYDDLQLREDLLDIALMIEAEQERGDSVSLDELKAGKRTYNVD